MAQTHAEADGQTDTIEGLETALYRALSESDHDDVRYQLRTALQKVQVLREGPATDSTER